MQLFLGDRVTLVKEDTFITGAISGIVLDKTKQLERVYIEHIDSPVWMYQGWRFVEDTEWEEEENG
jgi:hypothetical protein|tara:strand:+ start:182 stop:379 length:198 start_codon:yes stop_codon:yes gene_type:complete